jgi:PAS domain-containing protein
MEPSPLNRYLQKDFLYDELLCGFVSFSPDGKILSINKTMANWVGIEFATIKERNFKSLMTKSSMLYYSMVIDPLLNLSATVNEISLKFIAKEGDFDVLFSAQSYKNESGHIFLINATIQKIAERKKYENELLLEKRHAENERKKVEFLFNSAPNHLWTTNPDGEILTTNQKVKDYFGPGYPADPYGMQGVFKGDRKKTFEAVKRATASGTVFEREIRLLGLKGIPEWHLIKGEPFFNLDGHIEMWLCSATDINKQKLLQLANQAELKSSLSSAYKSLDENAELFVTIAMNQSHMIRKPLANILGLAKLIELEAHNGEFKDIVKLLLESVEELDVMIKNGLDGSTNKETGK